MLKTEITEINTVTYVINLIARIVDILRLLDET